MKRTFWKTLGGTITLVAAIALSFWLILPIQQRIHLGLDLQGGVRVLLQLKTSPEITKITPEIQGQVEQVVQNRVNGLGVSEPVITRVGDDRLLVELPAVKDPDEAVRTLRDVAVLEFKIVPPQVDAKALRDDKYANDANGAYKDSGPTVFSGSQLKRAEASFDQSGNPLIEFQTKDPVKFGLLTKANIGKNLGIFLDKKYLSAPVIQSIITDSGQISGKFSEAYVTRIANELNAGALPVPLEIIENDTVGPTLGKLDLQRSLQASMVGLGLVLIFMVAVYRLPGLLADVALLLYVLFLLAVLSLSQAVLTLPGIAGFVLSIGMAVDANVLIFERLKEELWSGKSLYSAVRIGFSRAFTSVFDSHFTTIVGAAVLYLLGTGTVKGFAFTLFWGTVFSLLTAVVITRFFVDVIVERDLVRSPSAWGATPAKLCRPRKSGAKAMFFRRQNWNIVGRFTLISTISYAIILAGMIALYVHHGLKLGLSFTGGTDVNVHFTRSVGQADVNNVFVELGAHDAKINTLTKAGDVPGQRYTIETQEAFGNTSDLLWEKLGTLAPVDRAQSQIQSVGPALSREYLTKALEALVVAIAIQFLYIAFRFEWNMIFGLVTVIALVRDSAMMIGIYAIADRPADDAFLAAVLTVVGYSVMDTIVILDRIRENTRLMPDSTYEHIVNTSILQTMTRSLNTLATVVVTLVALLALGGVSLQNFAFALLVGICSGGYHSIFYSAPLVVRFRALQQRREAKRLGAARASAGAAQALSDSERSDVINARKERREKNRTARGTGPKRYKRRRSQLDSEAMNRGELDPLDMQESAEYEEELMLGHEEIILNLDDEPRLEPGDAHKPGHGEV